MTSLTADQLEMIVNAIDLVAGSPDGCGEVTITIRASLVAFVRPAPNLDARSDHIEENAEWLQRQRETRYHRQK